jgi:hypothetical protein
VSAHVGIAVERPVADRARVRLEARVHDLVFLEPHRAVERLAAYRTRERPFRQVDAAMQLQVEHDLERFAARFAHVRTLAGVHSRVPLQCVLLAELSAALHALVAHLARVTSNVGLQVGHARERLRTVGAGERPGTLLVHQHVLLKAVLLEALAANLANERTLAGVRPTMNLQEAGMCVRTAAILADVPQATPARLPGVDFFSNACSGQSVGCEMPADVQFAFVAPSAGAATVQRLSHAVRRRDVIVESISVIEMLSTAVAKVREKSQRLVQRTVYAELVCIVERLTAFVANGSVLMTDGRVTGQ